MTLYKVRWQHPRDGKNSSQSGNWETFGCRLWDDEDTALSIAKSLSYIPGIAATAVVRVVREDKPVRFFGLHSDEHDGKEL